MDHYIHYIYIFYACLAFYSILYFNLPSYTNARGISLGGLILELVSWCTSIFAILCNDCRWHVVIKKSTSVFLDIACHISIQALSAQRSGLAPNMGLQIERCRTQVHQTSSYFAKFGYNISYIQKASTSQGHDCKPSAKTDTSCWQVSWHFPDPRSSTQAGRCRAGSACH